MTTTNGAACVELMRDTFRRAHFTCPELAMISFKDTRYILIDLDDTLVRCSPLIHFYFARCFIQALHPRLSTWRTLRVLHQMRTNAQILNGTANRERLIETFSLHSGLSLADCERLYDRVVMGILSDCTRFFSPIPKAQHFMREASAHFVFVLATNPLWPEEFARLRLKWGGISDTHFQLITHSQNMCHTKPHPAYFSEMLSKLNVDADACVFVGNSLRNDAPAATVNIPTVIVDNSLNPRLLRARSKNQAAVVAMSWQSLMSSLVQTTDGRV